jgi:hypothetical protein
MDGHPLTLGSIVEESIEECEVVHTSNKKVHLVNFLISGPPTSSPGFSRHSPDSGGCETRIILLGVLGKGKRRSVWGKRRSKPPVDCAETFIVSTSSLGFTPFEPANLVYADWVVPNFFPTTGAPRTVGVLGRPGRKRPHLL